MNKNNKKKNFYEDSGGELDHNRHDYAPTSAEKKAFGVLASLRESHINNIIASNVQTRASSLLAFFYTITIKRSIANRYTRAKIPYVCKVY